MLETKIFDPEDGFAPLTDPAVVTDSTLAKRDGRWWMYLAGKVMNRPGIQLMSASLPNGAPLAATGWTLTANPNNPAKVDTVAGQEASAPWDLNGGRHCPSYVRGWDPERGTWVERIYYAGGPQNAWGPYVIGYLEWDGARWVDQPEPAFAAAEEWERGSVYEPNLIYADGKWKMWYVAGENQNDHIVHGFAESADGRSKWTEHRMFTPPEKKVFDFCVLPVRDGYEAVFSRVWLAKSEPPGETGLWWCRADSPWPELSKWSEPVQIMTAEPRGWHAGPWKPSFQYSEGNANRILVFFDGLPERARYPFAFTLGCLEIDRPI